MRQTNSFSNNTKNKKMTLSFSQTYPERMGELAGQYNNFPGKIIMGLDLPLPKKCKLMDLLAEKTNGKFNNFFNKEHKIHTIRHDGKNRWKTGNKIHMVINNRTKDRFQFAPVLECKSVQKIEIKYHDKITKHWQYLIHGKNVSIKVNGHPLAYFDLC